jgi:hypothetical protein
VQWTMRMWGLLWSTRIRAAPQCPQVYSTVGRASSSNGGALATAARASGGGTILSVFCRRAGIAANQFGSKFGTQHNLVRAIAN